VAPSVLAQTIGASSLAQLLNPALATRPGQSATLLPDGRWLLLGGKNEDGLPLTTAIVTDPKTKQTFTLGAHLGQARTGHTATLMPDGTVLIVAAWSAAARWQTP